MLAALARKDSAQSKEAGPAGADDGEEQASTVAPTTVLEAVQALGRFARRSGCQLTRDDAPNLTGVIAPRAGLRDADLLGAVLDPALPIVERAVEFRR